MICDRARGILLIKKYMSQLLESQTEGNEAQKKMAIAMSKPWYHKIEAWLTVLNIIVLIINTGFLFNQSKTQKSIFSSIGSVQEVKCFSYTTYDSSARAWRWRAEHLNEYFPTKEDAFENCMAMLGGVIDSNSKDSQK